MEKELSARAVIRQWVRDEIENESEIDLPELADKAVSYFQTDNVIMGRLFAEGMRNLVYSLAESVLAQTRPNLRIVGGKAQDPEKLTTKVRKKAWEAWMEHVGDKHVRLVEMDRESLLTAAAGRRLSANRNVEIARLFEGIASRLEGGEVVGDRFGHDDIESLRIQLEAEEVKRQSRRRA